MEPFGLASMSTDKRRKLLKKYTNMLRQQVVKGEMSDVEALAKIAETTADFHSGYYFDDEKGFIDDMSYLLTDRYGRLGSEENKGYVRFGMTGFKDKHQDSGNQVRHFVGFVAAGYYWERFGGTLALIGNEDKLEGFISSPDYLLGHKAIDLAIAIQWDLPLEYVGDWIRKELAATNKCVSK